MIRPPPGSALFPYATFFRSPTTCLAADLHDPERLQAGAGEPLDLSEPVAVMLIGTIGHVEATAAKAIVQRLMAGVASGSYLALNQSTNNDVEWARAQDAYNHSGAPRCYLYTPAEIAELFTGLTLAGPGLVACTEWAPDTEPTTSYTEANMLGAVARKP